MQPASVRRKPHQPRIRPGITSDNNTNVTTRIASSLWQLTCLVLANSPNLVVHASIQSATQQTHFLSHLFNCLIDSTPNLFALQQQVLSVLNKVMLALILGASHWTRDNRLADIALTRHQTH